MALEFNQNFEKSISEQEGVRSKKIANTPLKTLIEASNRTDKKTMIDLLTKGDLQNNTLREINENADISEKFGRFFEQEGKNAKTSAKADKVLGSFQPFFQEAGYLAPRGNNPARILLSNVIGRKATEELFSTETVRKVPSPYPFETYTKLKQVVTGLLNGKTEAERLAGVQLGMHVIGGYRPSDFKNLKIENIDFTSGVVTDLIVKDRGKTTKKQGYFPAIIRDMILKEVNPEDTGLVFPQNNETVINNALKKANIPTEYTTAGKVKQGVFTLEDTRKLNETHLTSLGYDEKNPVRLAATLRASKTTIGQYVATGAGGRDIEELFVKTSSPHVAFTGTSNHAQYLSDLGVPASNIVKRYKVTNDVIDRFPLDRVAEFQERYPTLTFSDDNKVITSTLSPVNEGNAKLYQEKVTTELKTAKDLADIEYAKTAKQGEEARIKAQNIKKELRAEAKQQDIENRKSKIKDAKNFIFNTLGKPIKRGLIGALGVETARQFIQDPVGTGAAMASDLLLERGLGTGPGAFASFALQSSPAGEGSDIVRETGRFQTGEEAPTRQIGMESESANLLNQMQSNLQSEGADDMLRIPIDSGTVTMPDGSTRPFGPDVSRSKIGTFGRTPDVSPGFVTPPSKSDLADETQRQQNFLGVN